MDDYNMLIDTRLRASSVEQSSSGHYLLQKLKLDLADTNQCPGIDKSVLQSGIRENKLLKFN